MNKTLIYEFNEDVLVLSICNGTVNNRLKITNSERLVNPEKNLNELLANDLEEFMREKYLRALNINTESEQDAKAIKNLRESELSVREELRHNNVAHILYKNWYLEIDELYPIERFKPLFKPILDRNDIFLTNFLIDSNVEFDDITEVILSGSECQYSFVRKHLEMVLCRSRVLMKA